jgi:hypothetical protein
MPLSTLSVEANIWSSCFLSDFKRQCLRRGVNLNISDSEACMTKKLSCNTQFINNIGIYS